MSFSEKNECGTDRMDAAGLIEKPVRENVIYQGKIITLRVDDAMLPDGKPCKREMVMHPGGACVLFVREGKVLLVRQFRYAYGEITWEIPAGKLEYGEDPKTCGMRELNEEAYLECEELQLITSIVSTPGFCDERIWIYEAIHPKLTTHHLTQDEDENIDLVWLNINEAYQMILDQKIDDAKTIIAIQYAFINRK